MIMKKTRVLKIKIMKQELKEIGQLLEGVKKKTFLCREDKEEKNKLILAEIGEDIAKIQEKIKEVCPHLPSYA